MTVLSPMIWITSPSSCSSPTYCTSYMRGLSPVAVTTGPATRKISPVPFAATPLSACFVATSLPLESRHLYRSTPIALLIFSRRSSCCCSPTAMTTGRGVVSGRRRIWWLRPPRSAALRIRIPTFGSSRTLAIDDSRASFPTLTVFRIPASLKPWTNSSRSTAASSISYHQEFADHGRCQRALFPARDDPQVLDFAVLPDDVVEDRQHGQRVDVGIPTRLQEMESLDTPNQLADAEGLQVLEPARQIFGEIIVRQAGRQRVHVERGHFVEFGLRDFEAAVDEGVVLERPLGRTQPEEGLQVHDVDFSSNEFPHQTRAFGALGDDREQILVIEFRDEVLPRIPFPDLRGGLPQRMESLRIYRATEMFEDIVQGWKFDQALKERFSHTSRRHHVLEDFLRGRAEQLPAHDGLHVLDVKPIEVPSDHLSKLALGELDDLGVDRGKVPTRGAFDQVDARHSRREGQDLRLVRAFAEDARNLRDFHLEHPFVHVGGEKSRLLRTDAGGHIRIIPALNRDPFRDPTEDAGVTRRSRGRGGAHRGGHRTSATSLIESRQTSARRVSNRRSVRREPSALSITTPPTQSIVPAKRGPTIDRTASASRALL